MPAVPGPKFPLVGRPSMTSVRPNSPPAGLRTMMCTVSARSPSMMSSVPRPVIWSLPPPPRRMLPSAQTLPALVAVAPCPTSGQAPAADAGRIQRVAAGEAGAAEVAGGVVGAPDDVVQRTAGVGLCLLPAIAVDH